MARKMTLPKIGVNMTEAVITKWLVKVGDTVKEGDPIIEAETDKSSQEIYATESGIIADILAAEGTTVQCHEEIAVFIDEGEKYVKEESPKAAPVPAAAPAATPAPAASAPAAPVYVAPATVPVSAPASGRIRISPLARKMAREKGYDLAALAMQFPGKRIVKKDIEKFASAACVCTCAGGDFDVRPMSMMRKTIASRMTQSVMTKPSVSLVTTIDATALIALRNKYKQKDIKISMDAILAKIASRALSEHRNINACIEGDAIHMKNDINVGVAVDTEKGLMVPVIKNADRKNLREIASELTLKVRDAKDFRLSADDMTGGTFTITNLGMFGIEEFSPIINPPECCILGIGAMKREFVPDENDMPKAVTTFKATLVFDHCIVDGAPAARFLRTFKEYAEMPEMLI